MEKIDTKALFNIGYGLYVVTTKDEFKDNGLVVNTVCQLTSTPNRVAVTVNKSNYSFDIIKKTGKMNVNCLSEEATFDVFKRFGFCSGRNTNKFESMNFSRSENGLIYLDNSINSYMSLAVEKYVDVDTHGMFICTLDEAKIVSDVPTMTYNYYQKFVKQKPNLQNQDSTKKKFVCKICGYVYEGETLPEDFICPLCKHSASDFEPMN